MRPLRKSHPLLNLHRLTFLRPPPLSQAPLSCFHRSTHLPNSWKPRSLTTPTCSKLPKPIFEITSLASSIGGSSLWSGIYHSPATSALYKATCSILESRGVDTDTGRECGLGSKTPPQSRISILYKFSTDLALREQYRNPWNRMRIGKLLVDLDVLAGAVSLKHCCSDDGTRRPLLLVTASVDKMVMKKPIRVDADVNIVGSVTWVGRSSLEIQLQVSQLTKDPLDSLALVANFTFVALNSKMDKSVPINRISPETEEEKLLWQEAEKRNKNWKKKRAEYRTDTSVKDTNRLQTLLSEGRIALADRDSILIRDTRLENSFMCQPQHRNVYGRIFGGFLMQKAFEVAFSTTYAFAGVAPLFVEVDHVDFLKPVDVGDFVRLKSCVLYTKLENPDKPMINVEVVAHVTKHELIRSSEVSNKFYFTFTVPPEAMRDGLRIRNVVPETEEEGRRVLERMEDRDKQEYLDSH